MLLCLILLLPVLVYADKAPKVYRNPKGVVAHVDFPFGGNQYLRGNIVINAPEGKAVDVRIDMTGMPREGGPFYYHIHDESVPGDGNCNMLGDVFNPYIAASDCSTQRDDSFCQVGDLSGKHGWINSTCFEFGYTDPYISLNPKLRAYVIGRLISFHFANTTAFACADVELATPSKLVTLREEGLYMAPIPKALDRPDAVTALDVSAELVATAMPFARTHHESPPMMELFDADEALKQEVFELGNPIVEFTTGAEFMHGPNSRTLEHLLPATEMMISTTANYPLTSAPTLFGYADDENENWTISVTSRFNVSGSFAAPFAKPTVMPARRYSNLTLANITGYFESNKTARVTGFLARNGDDDDDEFDNDEEEPDYHEKSKHENVSLAVRICWQTIMALVVSLVV